LKIWITPLASVAMLEKLALLKIALCSAPILTLDSSALNAALTWFASVLGCARPVLASELAIRVS
jgi:hypothetical protein